MEGAGCIDKISPQVPSSLFRIMSNNILLACERCRGQKLRCDWSTVRPDACCDRCTRLGVPCVRNPQRRVGRPRSRLINRSSDSPPRRPTVATDPLVTPLHAPEQTWPADLPRWPKQLEQQQRQQQQQPVEGFWDGTQYPTAISSVTQTSSLAVSLDAGILFLFSLSNTRTSKSHTR